VDVETFDVDNGRLVQSRIGFSIASRRDTGVVQISEMGVKAPKKKITTKYVVIACLNKLVNIGYTMPTLSSLTIQVIDAGWYHDVAGFCARIARTNRKDVVKSKSNSYLIFRFVVIGKLCSHIHFFGQHLQVEDYDLSNAGCSFETLLNQTIYALGYD
jgi:hypothetical protein